MNALVVSAYGALGVRYLRWLASGQSCPYCQSMSGKIVGIDGYFVVDGSNITVPGLDALPINGNRRHAPLHRGCDCVVVAA